ncbi:Bug family tripartite tricarboxylate transporter substrate binding protein [Bordetella tumulicola]|uniref:Bug family tripartite tricarboxylate transporter substrate binding protein n=1 Tax=Bordetella tumulicola TaxID=1649133 RepID=UPI0039EFE873
MLKKWMNTFSGLAMMCAAMSPAYAAWPDRPITFVVPYTPGTGIDTIARQLAARLPQALGQPVIVENVPGASGNIGSEKVARSKPDGYTFLVQVNTLVMNKSLYPKLPYDPVNDFDPVSQTSWGTLLLVENPSVQKTSTVKDIIDLAKSRPKQLTYATPGVGTPHHLAMALFLQQGNVDMLHVPYKGTAGAVTDLLGGRIDYMFLPVHVALPHIQSGKLKAVATGSAKRLPQLPEVPTLSEAGVTSDNLDMWYGVLAPKGTPPDVVDRLNQEIAKILAETEVAKAFESQGMVPAPSAPDAFRSLITKDEKRWAEVVKKGNISTE